MTSILKARTESSDKLPICPFCHAPEVNIGKFKHVHICEYIQFVGNAPSQGLESICDIAEAHGPNYMMAILDELGVKYTMFNVGTPVARYVDIWVDKSVAAVINGYRAFAGKFDDGFAGMTFEEYLTKMLKDDI